MKNILQYLSILSVAYNHQMKSHGFTIPNSHIPITTKDQRCTKTNIHPRPDTHINPIRNFQHFKHKHSFHLHATTDTNTNLEPQVIATGYSQATNLLTAVTEATQTALSSLPPGTTQIDLGLVSVSSLYDGQPGSTEIVSTIVELCGGQGDGIEVRNLVGSSCGGMVGSYPTTGGEKEGGRGCVPMETEGALGVVVTLMLLPDTNIQTFHVLGDDVPDDIGRLAPEAWKNAVGLRNFQSNPPDNNNNSKEEALAPTFFLLPSPSFQNELDDLLRGLSATFPPTTTVFGGLASTVSSLSRARLFRYNSQNPDNTNVYADGCIGVAMEGDVKVKTMVAQGAKPVGGVYRIVSGRESTIGAIRLDEDATRQLEDLESSMENEDGDEEEEEMDAKKRMAAAYAKAAIPKPVLAEANYVMRTLSDDDKAFMRRAILVGLERSSGSVGDSPDELLRLSEGKGHRFAVRQVASAGMKDGSVTLPLGSVEVREGTRFRFFVRDGNFARREVEALWMGFKKRALEESFLGSNDEGSKSESFTPTACLFMPTLDRGTKLFGGRPGYESGQISEFLPGLSSISGFFTNGVIAKLEDGADNVGERVAVHGSASCYALIGSRTKGRPVYDPTRDTKETKDTEIEEVKEEMKEEVVMEEVMEISPPSTPTTSTPAPRSEDGELIIKRREVHSGRALTVSSVEWSVAEKAADPTSALEGFMWDKETEVDRFRERVPLSNLVSQCKLSDLDPQKPKPRDWVGPIQAAITSSPDTLLIIPEIKRLDPSSGSSLYRRFDTTKLAKQLTLGGAPALSVNCDGILFGGSMEDLTVARESSSSAALEVPDAEDGVVPPPVLASDLVLYPYQLYRLRLAGADAVRLVAGSLPAKDLLYLTKIAKSLGMQTVVSVASEVQIRAVTGLAPGSVSALVVSNRDLETYGYDESGEQALSLLKSSAIEEFKKVHGEDVLVFVEGRVGLVEMMGATKTYLKALKDAGASGAIVGAAIAARVEDDAAESLRLIQDDC